MKPDYARILARTTDPETSHEAARLPRKGELIKGAVLAILGEDGPATHDQIVGRYNARLAAGHDYPPAGASSIRTRVAELVDEGLVDVLEAEWGRSTMGNRARRWRLVDQDDDE